MLSYRHALETMLSGIQPQGTESVPLMQAHGRVLATALVAPYDMPPYHQSMMDGYALRSRDTQHATVQQPARLMLGETLTAGALASRALGPRRAVRIMTGAPLPRGADVVIKMEESRREGDTLLVEAPLPRYLNMQRSGAEITRSTVVLPAGALLTPQRIGVALALGLHTVEVIRRPCVAVVAPGNELLPPGAALQPGKKWCSNLYALELRLQELGCTSVNLGIVPDTLESLATALQGGLNSDVLVILGASGRGDHDFAAGAMGRLGGTILFRGVATMPGGSVTVARCHHTLIVGLPGSPWASFVSFEVFVWPLLRALLGIEPALPPTQAAGLTTAVHSRTGVTHFVPARVQSQAQGWLVTPLEDLLDLARNEPHALGLITVPAHRRHVAAGTSVRVHHLSTAYGQ